MTANPGQPSWSHSPVRRRSVGPDWDDRNSYAWALAGASPQRPLPSVLPVPGMDVSSDIRVPTATTGASTSRSLTSPTRRKPAAPSLMRSWAPAQQLAGRDGGQQPLRPLVPERLPDPRGEVGAVYWTALDCPQGPRGQANTKGLGAEPGSRQAHGGLGKHATRHRWADRSPTRGLRCAITLASRTRQGIRSWNLRGQGSRADGSTAQNNPSDTPLRMTISSLKSPSLRPEVMAMSSMPST